MTTRKQSTTRTAKAAETKSRILEAALALFEEGGYEKATMRAIAERAGVAASNAYYYFRSKEELVQAFYARTHQEHLLLVEPALEQETSLKGRLLAVMRTKLDTIERYHPFAGVLFKSAADPNSPLNPFSAESRPVREEATAVFARAIEGAKGKVPKDLRAELPELLWTWHMSVILFWIHDRSEGRARTWRLTERTIDLIVKLISVSGLPLMGPLRRSALELIADFKLEDVELEGEGEGAESE